MERSRAAWKASWSTETRLSHVDGERGELVIGGFAVEELAPHARFEEVLHLLWHGRLPSARRSAPRCAASWRRSAALPDDDAGAAARRRGSGGAARWTRCAWASPR